MRAGYKLMKFIKKPVIIEAIQWNGENAEEIAKLSNGINELEFCDDYVYRVAWRILRHWVDSQMAIIELEMVQIEQVFLPYIINKNGKTLGENFVNNPQLLLN